MAYIGFKLAVLESISAACLHVCRRLTMEFPDRLLLRSLPTCVTLPAIRADPGKVANKPKQRGGHLSGTLAF